MGLHYPGITLERLRKRTELSARIAGIWAGLEPGTPEYDVGKLNSLQTCCVGRWERFNETDQERVSEEVNYMHLTQRSGSNCGSGVQTIWP
jgi:hypothetical protein